MKKLVLILLICCPALLLAQQGRTYSIRIRVQAMDTTVYCSCPEDDNTSDYGGPPDCNSIENAMISIYADTTFLKTFYTNQIGYSPWFNLPYGKYRLVINAHKYNSATLLLDFTAADKRNSILSSKGSQLHYKNEGNNYFVCLILSGERQKKGVRIMPKQ
jgi:hypothetical protein